MLVLFYINYNDTALETFEIFRAFASALEKILNVYQYHVMLIFNHFMAQHQKYMIEEIKQLFNKLHEDTKQALQFCLECENLCYYADLDTCNCGTRYDPTETNEACPNCGKGGDDDYISHCSVCDAEIDISYLSFYIDNPDHLSHEQIINIKTQLEKIVNANYSG